MQIWAQDSYDNFVPSYSGTLVLTSGDVNATYPPSPVCTAGQVILANAISFSSLGSQYLAVSDSANVLTGVTQSLTVSPNGTSVASLGLGGPSLVVAGVATNLMLKAFDGSGNTAANYRGTVQFSSTDANAVLPAAQVFGAGDVGNKVVSVTLATAGMQSVIATDAALGLSRNLILTVAAAPAQHLALTVASSLSAGNAADVQLSALDAYGNIASSYMGTVHFSASDNQAQLPPALRLTGGSTTLSNAVVFKQAGTQMLTAADNANVLGAVSQNIVVTANQPTRLNLHAPANATAGTVATIDIAVTDAYANVVDTYLGTVSFSSSDGFAVLPSPYPMILSDAGTKTFSAGMQLQTAGVQQVVLRDLAAALSTQQNVVVSAAAATSLTLAGNTTTMAGSADSFMLSVVDGYGNAVAAYRGTVQLSCSDSQAALQSVKVFSAGDAGRSALTVILRTVGIQALTAVDISNSNLTATLSPLTVVPSPAAQLRMVLPHTATAGMALSSVTIVAQDLYGNLVSSYSGTVQLSSSDAAAIIPAAVLLNAGTVVLNSNITFKTVGSQALTASDGAGTLLGTQQSTAVLPAVASSMLLTTPASSIAGSAAPVTFTAFDSYGNIASGYSGTLHFSSSDANAVVPSATTVLPADHGIKTLTVTWQATGSQTLAVSDSALGLIAAANVTVLASPAVRLQLLTNATATAGSGLTASVATLDTYGNIAVGYVGTVCFSSSDANAQLPAPFTLPGGTITLAHGVTLESVGSQSVAVTGSSGSIIGSSQNVLVSASPSIHLILSAPTSGTAGVPVTLAVKASDTYGNLVAGYLGTVTFSSSDANAVLPSNYVFAPGDGGQKTFVGSTTFKLAGSASITAAASGPGPSPSTQMVSISPAAAAALVSTGTTMATAGSTATLTVVALDAYNNVATGYGGTLHFSTSDAQATLPANVVFSGATPGTATVGVVFAAAGTNSVTATDLTTPSLTTTLGNISVSSGTPRQLGLTMLANATAGVPLASVVISAQDAYGNVVPSYAGTANLSSGDANAVFPASRALTAGSNTLSSLVTFKTAGQQYFAATDSAGILASKQQSVLVSTAGSAVASLQLKGPATVSAGIANPFVVTAYDNSGNIVTGYKGTIAFSSSDPNAALPANYAFVAGDNGSKSLTVTLRSAGNRTVLVTDASNGFSVNLTVSVTATAAQRLLLTSPSSVVAGQPFNINVAALDALGNIATGYTGTVVFSATDSNALLPPSFTLAGGTALLNNAVMFKTTGLKTLTAADIAASITASSQNVTSSSAAAAVLALSSPSPVIAGAINTCSVTVFDAYGNVAPLYTGTIQFNSSDANAVVPSNYTFTGANAGSKTFANTLQLKTAGTQTVLVQDISAQLASSQLSITVNPNTVASLSLTGSTSLTAGNAESLTGMALDAYGNPATAYAGTVRLTSSDTQALLPANVVFTPSNHATVTLSPVLSTAGNQNVVLTDIGNSNLAATLGNIAVAPSSAQKLKLTMASIATAGTPLVTVTVTAQDAYGNVALQYNGSVILTSSDANVVVPAPVVLSAGTAVLSNAVIFKSTGTQSLTATDAASVLTGTTQSAVVAPGVIISLQLSGTTSSVAGSLYALQISSLDAYNNVVGGYRGTVHVTSSDTNAVLPANLVFGAGDAGIKTTTVTLKTLAAQTITAADVGGIPSRTLNLSVTAAAAQTLSLSIPASSLAGQPLTVTVATLDAYGNIAAGYLGTVRFSTTDANALLPASLTLAGGTTTLANAVILKSAGNQNVVVADSAGNILSSSQNVVVSASPPANLILSAPTSVVAGVPGSLTVKAIDAYGNLTAGYVGTVHFSSSDANAVLPSNYVFTSANSGQKTFAGGVTLKLAGSSSITVADIIPGPSPSTQVVSIAPAAAASLVSTGATTAIAGSTAAMTVTVLDAFNNIATGYTGTLHFSSSDVQATLPANMVFPGATPGIVVTGAVFGCCRHGKFDRDRCSHREPYDHFKRHQRQQRYTASAWPGDAGQRHRRSTVGQCGDQRPRCLRQRCHQLYRHRKP